MMLQVLAWKGYQDLSRHVDLCHDMKETANEELDSVVCRLFLDTHRCAAEEMEDSNKLAERIRLASKQGTEMTRTASELIHSFYLATRQVFFTCHTCTAQHLTMQ